MKYTAEDFKKDLKDPQFPHIKDKEHFKAFYTELGRVAEPQKYHERRMSFVTPQGKILELGCHSGFNLIHYARQGFDCMGVDVSPTLLDMAIEAISKEPLEVQKRIRIKESFIEDLELKEKFDTIILTEVLEHCIYPISILKKSRTLLSSKGKIYISCPKALSGNSSHVRGISEDEMRKLLWINYLRPIKWFNISGNTTVIAEKSKIPKKDKNKSYFVIVKHFK